MRGSREAPSSSLPAGNTQYALLLQSQVSEHSPHRLRWRDEHSTCRAALWHISTSLSPSAAYPQHDSPRCGTHWKSLTSVNGDTAYMCATCECQPSPNSIRFSQNTSSPSGTYCTFRGAGSTSPSRPACAAASVRGLGVVRVTVRRTLCPAGARAGPPVRLLPREGSNCAAASLEFRYESARRAVL